VNSAGAASRRRAAAHLVVADVGSPDPDDAARHHLFRVLRLRDGEVVTVTDGAGRWRSCRVTGGELALDGDVVEEVPLASPVGIAVAIPKQDRPEWIVQKLTELGVARVVLVHAARSVVRWAPERAARHVDRLARVAVEALQQSRGVWLPRIEGPLPAADVLPTAVAADPGGRSLRPSDRTIAIGPEGGWTDDELALAADTVTLGETVLRVETAAVTAAARAVAHSS
jgi:16S rRNA (uracil1498-N3)-methyltransferase